MKKAYLIGLLSFLLIFFQCKNEKATQEPTPSNELKKDVIKEMDTSTILPKTEDIEAVKETEVTPSKTTTENKTNTTVDVKKKTTAVVKAPVLTPKETEKEVSQPVKEVIALTPTKIEKSVIAEATKKIASNSNWVVPANYKTMKNPTDSKIDLAIGKSLYTKHCKSCHGTEGLGDGPKAEGLKGDLGDFSSVNFQGQTDGELFYKTTIGRDDMPEFSKKLPQDVDRWLIVNYLRTLVK